MFVFIFYECTKSNVYWNISKYLPNWIIVYCCFVMNCLRVLLLFYNVSIRINFLSYSYKIFIEYLRINKLKYLLNIKSCSLYNFFTIDVMNNKYFSNLNKKIEILLFQRITHSLIKSEQTIHSPISKHRFTKHQKATVVHISIN